MASQTVPTVAFPTPTDIDDTDTDTDDDDDDVSSVLPGQPPATNGPAQPPSPPPPATVAPAPAPGVTNVSVQPAPNTHAPEQSPSPTDQSRILSGVDSSASPTATGLADSLPSGGVPNPIVPVNAPANENQGLSVGATAGIGVGAALAVILLAIAGWMFARRRRRRMRRTRTASSDSTLNHESPDEEIARKSEIYAYHAGGPIEIGDGKDVGVDPRRRSELASPVVPVEAMGDREFAAELQGSEVPARGGKEGERLFSDAPIDERDEPDDTEPRSIEKKG